MGRTTLTRKPATYQDVLAAPEGLRAEILLGELHLSPAPGSPHTLAATGLTIDLANPWSRGRGGPGGWVILAERELWLGAHDPTTIVVVPDLCGWRRERWPGHSDEHGHTVAPDWVCEVLSPTSLRRDRVEKVQVYAEAGIPWYWLVDPAARTLEVLQLDGESYRIHQTFGGSESVAADPFAAVPLDLAGLWNA